MSLQWLIVADDLTGAADSAIAFAKRGLNTLVSWDDRSVWTGSMPSVLAFNTLSREMDKERGSLAHLAALERWWHPNIKLFKKIDSTLRGEPAAEIATMLKHVRAHHPATLGIVAPAFPALGRTTRDGHVYVRGTPLEETELWARDRTYPSADLVQILATEGLRAEKVSLPMVRSERGSLTAMLQAICNRGAIAVCDAALQLDLHAIVQATTLLNQNLFFVGTGGLAQSLAQFCNVESSAYVAPSFKSATGALIVVGSLAQASRDAARKLTSTQNVVHMPLPDDLLRNAATQDVSRQFTQQVIAALKSGKDVLAEIIFAEQPRAAAISELLTGLRKILAPCVREASAIAATGGETAAASMSAAGITGLQLVDEIEPGVCLGASTGALSLPVTTKAGAFGDEHSLVRIVERLRKVRQTGSIR